MALSGCATWNNPGGAPAAYVRHQTPNVVHAFLVGGDSAVVWRPIIRNDSLVGLIPGSAAPGHPLLTFGEPMTSIDSISVREVDFSKTFSTLLAPVLAGAWVFVLVGF
jgi:hypothetical protein